VGTLSSPGVTQDQVPRLVDIAVKDICHQTNPRPVSAQDFERLFAAAM
jgi:alcohol dehydrogenase class IV